MQDCRSGNNDPTKPRLPSTLSIGQVGMRNPAYGTGQEQSRAVHPRGRSLGCRCVPPCPLVNDCLLCLRDCTKLRVFPLCTQHPSSSNNPPILHRRILLGCLADRLLTSQTIAQVNPICPQIYSSSTVKGANMPSAPFSANSNLKPRASHFTLHMTKESS